MKIVKESAEQLILQERLLGIWFLGFCTASVGFFLIFAFDTPVDLFGGFCIAVAVVIGTLSPMATCTFDRTTHQVIMEQRHWFSRRVQHHTLTQITAVTVEPYLVVGTEFYRVTVILATGQRLSLTRSASTDQTAQATLADRIRDFLMPERQSVPAGTAPGLAVEQPSSA